MRNSFSSKIGVLLAAAGSAVGLGSIWKFPYTVGENGGGAFINIGKLSGRSAFGAFRQLSGNNRWQWLSWTALLSVVLLLGFYFVVTVSYKIHLKQYNLRQHKTI